MTLESGNDSIILDDGVTAALRKINGMARQFPLFYSDLASDNILVFLLDMGSDSSKQLPTMSFPHGVGSGECHEKQRSGKLSIMIKPQEAKMNGETSPRQR